MSASRTSALHTGAALLLGVVATCLAYPPAQVPGIGLVMLAPIAWLLDGVSPRRGFALAWLYTFSFGLWLCRFLVHALVVEYGVAPLPAWTFTTLVIAAFALVPAAAGGAYAALRPAGALAPIAFAAIWTIGEWVRGSVLALPWLLAAQSVVRVPIALQIADAVGHYGISFAVLAVGGGVGLALRRRDPRMLVGPALVCVVWLGYGAVQLARFDETGARRMTIGVVQASVPQAERFQPGSAYRNVARHEAATRALAREGALDLVVWSETAVDVDLDKTPALLRTLHALATEIGAPIVTGAPRSARGRPTNAVVLVAPRRGLAESYDKQRLVPFSEYDPPGFGWIAKLIGPVVEGEPYLAGTAATVFRSAPIPFAAPVCFEITDARIVGRFRNEGARLLVNLSNDAWFGRIGYPEMHFDHAILRAVEMRSTVVRGANTGISGVIDASGRVVAVQPVLTEGTLRVEVAEAGPIPLYPQTGDAPIVVALFIAAAGAMRRPGAAPGAGPRRIGSARRAEAHGRAR